MRTLKGFLASVDEMCQVVDVYVENHPISSLESEIVMMKNGDEIDFVEMPDPMANLEVYLETLRDTYRRVQEEKPDAVGVLDGMTGIVLEGDPLCFALGLDDPWTRGALGVALFVTASLFLVMRVKIEGIDDVWRDVQVTDAGALETAMRSAMINQG